uniref:TOG domain-containing protein n=1 Tax=Aegilops tauschii subsp. strangulata TaxID=200361 RepID=A0A453IS89_AEGTS
MTPSCIFPWDYQWSSSPGLLSSLLSWFPMSRGIVFDGTSAHAGTKRMEFNIQSAFPNSLEQLQWEVAWLFGSGRKTSAARPCLMHNMQFPLPPDKPRAVQGIFHTQLQSRRPPDHQPKKKSDAPKCLPPTQLQVLMLDCVELQPWPSFRMDRTDGNKVRLMPWPSFACSHVDMTLKHDGVRPQVTDGMQKLFGDLNSLRASSRYRPNVQLMTPCILEKVVCQITMVPRDILVPSQLIMPFMDDLNLDTLERQLVIVYLQPSYELHVRDVQPRIRFSQNNLHLKLSRSSAAIWVFCAVLSGHPSFMLQNGLTPGMQQQAGQLHFHICPSNNPSWGFWDPGVQTMANLALCSITSASIIWSWTLPLFGSVNTATIQQHVACNRICLQLHQFGLVTMHLIDGIPLCLYEYTATGDFVYESWQQQYNFSGRYGRILTDKFLHLWSLKHDNYDSSFIKHVKLPTAFDQHHSYLATGVVHMLVLVLQDLNAAQFVMLEKSKEQRFHELLEPLIVPSVKSVTNLRSVACRTALMTCADIFQAYGKQMTDSVDLLLMPLFLKSSQDKRIVCEAAEATIITKMQPYLKYRNPRIQAKASVCISKSVPCLGLEGINGMDKQTITESKHEVIQAATYVHKSWHPGGDKTTTVFAPSVNILQSVCCSTFRSGRNEKWSSECTRRSESSELGCHDSRCFTGNVVIGPARYTIIRCFPWDPGKLQTNVSQEVS